MDRRQMLWLMGAGLLGFGAALGIFESGCTEGRTSSKREGSAGTSKSEIDFKALCLEVMGPCFKRWGLTRIYVPPSRHGLYRFEIYSETAGFVLAWDLILEDWLRSTVKYRRGSVPGLKGEEWDEIAVEQVVDAMGGAHDWSVKAFTEDDVRAILQRYVEVAPQYLGPFFTGERRFIPKILAGYRQLREKYNHARPIDLKKEEQLAKSSKGKYIIAESIVRLDDFNREVLHGKAVLFTPTEGASFDQKMKEDESFCREMMARHYICFDLGIDVCRVPFPTSP